MKSGEDREGKAKIWCDKIRNVFLLRGASEKTIKFRKPESTERAARERERREKKSFRNERGIIKS